MKYGNKMSNGVFTLLLCSFLFVLSCKNPGGTAIQPDDNKKNPPANAVKPKALIITGATHTKPYDGTTAADGVLNITFDGIADGDEVSALAVTAEYTGVNAGTTTIIITAVTLGGAAKDNYTVTLPANNVTASGGGISRPSDSQTLIQSSLSSKSSKVKVSVTLGDVFPARRTASAMFPLRRWGKHCLRRSFTLVHSAAYCLA